MISCEEIFIFVLLLSINIVILRAECNVCSATTEMACVSETQYQACVNNVPSGSVNTCPTGYVCSTLTPITCQSGLSGIPATCNDCHVCNANGVFACTGVRTYALCLGTSVPTASTGICVGSLVCDISLPQICGDPTTGIAATCPTVNDTSIAPTTTPPILQTYAQYWCQLTRINARFPMPRDLDTSCKNYLYCFLTSNSTWSGQIYTCAGRTYFDSYSRYCVATRPTGC